MGSMRKFRNLFNLSKHLLLDTKIGFYVSLAILLITSCLVGYQGALVQSYNFDQLIDNYIFESVQSFHEAIFPSAHTFMLKWPIFAIGGILGNSKEVFTALTIAVYLVSVFGFLAIIHYAVKRKYMITTLMAYLLAVLLLLIPAQQSPGDVMPVNMAMLTTRNVEYVLYILFCYFAIKSKRLFDRSGVIAFLFILTLTLSDKLMFYIAILTTIIAFLYKFAAVKKYHLSQITAIVYTGLAFAASSIIVRFINVMGITTINSDNASISTTTQDSVRSIFNTTLDAVEAIMRNFGANIFNDQPSMSLFIGIIGFIFFVICLYAMYRLLSERANKSKDTTALIVGKWLVFSSLAALIVYVGIARNDGISVRYLSIFVFAGIYALALWICEMNPKLLRVVCSRTILVSLLILPVAALASLHSSNASIEKSSAASGIKDAHYISQSLRERKVDLFVGIYYIGALTRYESNNTIRIAPILDFGCAPSPTKYLTSEYWYEPDNKTQAVALYVIDDHNGRGTINNGCSNKYLESVLGGPSNVVDIPDSPGKLYIYDYDIRKKLF